MLVAARRAGTGTIAGGTIGGYTGQTRWGHTGIPGRICCGAIGPRPGVGAFSGWGAFAAEQTRSTISMRFGRKFGIGSCTEVSRLSSGAFRRASPGQGDCVSVIACRKRSRSGPLIG